ncbi:conserved hypothetical protein [Rhodospirillum centenum SW]|uniref:Uncharacterized protein n=1 Tax=Rhodospirillum centenum (strain ATCC 51521 / SW) TaxID=414684 RepID=B6IRB7_RHOCS|nr:conserved hypothetical protein [Rhodospirillum centenum SW]
MLCCAPWTRASAPGGRTASAYPAGGADRTAGQGHHLARAADGEGDRPAASLLPEGRARRGAV